MRHSILLATGAIMLSGCGFSARADTGPRVDRNYPVTNFTGIGVAGPYEVTVRTGAAPSVRATGSQAALDAMTVEIHDGTLDIGHRKSSGFDWNWFGKQHGKVSLVVTVPTLEHAGIAGSGGIKVDKVNGPHFKGEVAGSGDLELASIDSANVEFSIAGSGDIRAGGRAKSVAYEIAGSGDIDASRLNAETAKLSIAGSGGIKGHASGTAQIEIMGSGDVDLAGGAKCSVSKAGSGSVRCS